MITFELYALFKVICKRLLVKEDVWVLEILVEPVLHLLHARQYALKVAIACKNDEGCFRFAIRKNYGGVAEIFLRN
jgi:hypothetical protein